MSNTPNPGLGRVLFIADAVRRAADSTGLNASNVNRIAEVLATELQPSRPFDSEIHSALLRLKQDQKHSALFGEPTAEVWHHQGKLIGEQDMKALKPMDRLRAVNRKAWDDSHD